MGCACMKTDVAMKNHSFNEKKLSHSLEKNDSKEESRKSSSNNGKIKLIYF